MDSRIVIVSIQPELLILHIFLAFMPTITTIPHNPPTIHLRNAYAPILPRRSGSTMRIPPVLLMILISKMERGRLAAKPDLTVQTAAILGEKTLHTKETTMPHITINDRTAIEVFPGIDLRTFWGEKIMLSVADLEPGAKLPPHSHPHEQAGVILSRELRLNIDGDERLLKPGDIYIAEGGVEHSGEAGPQGCRALDIFNPIREDYQFE